MTLIYKYIPLSYEKIKWFANKKTNKKSINRRTCAAHVRVRVRVSVRVRVRVRRIHKAPSVQPLV